MSRTSGLAFAVLATTVIAVGCEGDRGARGRRGEEGPRGRDGTSCTVTSNDDGSYVVTCDGNSVTLYDGKAELSGTVTNSLTAAAIAGATITLDPAVPGISLASDATGAYAALLPIGTYTVTITASGYGRVQQSVDLVAGLSKTVDAALAPVAPVLVTVTAGATTLDPGASTTLSATVESFDGTTATGYAWTQLSGPPATLTPGGASAAVVLADTEAYKAELWRLAQLPDRLRVAPAAPYALEEAASTELAVTVTTSDGETYQGTVTLDVALPVDASGGIRNVARGVPLMLHAPDPVATGSITAVAGAALADGETFVIGDGTHPAVSFELDSNASVTAGHVRVAFSAANSAAQVAAAIRAAVNAAPGLDVTANIAPIEYDPGFDIVWLAADAPGTTFDVAITTTVADAGFVVAGMGGAGVIAWTLTDPTSADVTDLFDDATSQNPVFTPPAQGKYTATLAARPGIPARDLLIYAGDWMGIVTGIDAAGNPETAGCDNAGCHAGNPALQAAVTRIADEWRQTGHAHIFTKNVDNPAGHYSTSCLVCHTVGYDPAVSNGGVDDVADWPAFETAYVNPTTGAIHGAVGEWADIVDDEPTVARMANVQCEHCHGPGGSLGDQGPGFGHGGTPGTPNPARFSIGSQLCGACHGEPPRHGRFEQWQLSGHGNFELALEEATLESRSVSSRSVGPGHCGRCHSAEGFLEWIKEPDLANCVGQYKTAAVSGVASCSSVPDVTKYVTYLSQIGLTDAKVHAIECAVCHDPHAEGQSSGVPNTATVRITDTTKNLPAGYRAVAIGRGAICITCHNTRNGARSDAIGLSPSSYDTSPHVAAQGDVLMGQNAYLVATDVRSRHADVGDACPACHMVKTTPPPQFSYEGTGTNHVFTASPDICVDCHGEGFENIGLQDAVANGILDIGDLLAAQVTSRIDTFVAGTAFQAVTGRITVTAVPANGETLTVSDGRGNTKVFEFRSSGNASGTNVKITVPASPTLGDVASAIVSAINGATTVTSTAPPFFAPGTSFQVTAANPVDAYGTAGPEIALALDYNTTGTVGTAAIVDGTGGDLTVVDFAAQADGGGGAFTVTGAFWPDPSGAEQTIDDASLRGLTQAPGAVSLVEVHGRMGFELTFATAIPVTYVGASSGPAQVTQIEVQASGLARYIPVSGITGLDALGPRLFDESFDTFYKAQWNYYLVHSDGSEGVHNPSWVFDLLAATTDALFDTAACAGVAWTGGNGACL